MTDFHVHIGQFNEAYFDALEIFNAIESTFEKTGVSEIYYSSLSSCRDDVELSKIEEETRYAQKFTSNVLHARPYLWLVPKYAEEKIDLENALCAFDYAGIKLHPFAQKWHFENPLHRKSLKKAFAWSAENQTFILIHTGMTERCLPNRFEIFFKEFPKAKVILAHSSPVEMTAELLNEYENIFCDTAYADESHIKQLFAKAADTSKILFGTDFPITHYYGEQSFGKRLALGEQYEADCKKFYRLAKRFAK